MKKILITGSNSYIGVSFEEYLKRSGDKYQVDTVNMIGDEWRSTSFAGYDAVFHVSGIAHSDVNKVGEDEQALYYRVNRDLTIETAKKAKADGVGQFIFMSSIIVYGESAPIGRIKRITADTQPAPANFYGDSKLQAEQGILPLQDEHFRVTVLRPPMIYGKGSRGNYRTLSRFAQKLPIFPYVKNERSMLYIENLCEFVRLMIENRESGIFYPQNGEYSNTAELVKMIAAAHGKKRPTPKGFAWCLKLLGHLSGMVNKAFGSISYDMALSEYHENYRVCTLAESIAKTEEE